MAYVMLALLCVGACRPAPAPPAAASRSNATSAPMLGQWVWTRADLSQFEAARTERPTLQAGVFVGTVQCDAVRHHLSARVALSVATIVTAPVAAVIRFEDGLDRCRDTDGSSHNFDAALDSAVRVLRDRVRAAHQEVRDIQLDYDAPQRALPVWARSVARLRATALRGDRVWMTSLIAHLREPAYGSLFREVIDGHILQVFDTGEDATKRQVAEALRLAARAGLPFQLGVGAFERETSRGATDHRSWFVVIPQFAALPAYRGVWVFPAGRPWVSLVRERV
jgi:hypothetical protein